MMKPPIFFQYFFAFISALLGLRLLYREFGRDLHLGWGLNRQRREVLRVVEQLREIEEVLGGGMVPSQENWEQLKALPAPWGSLAFDSLRELRANGGAVLPTLRRLKDLATGQLRALADAKARSAQAMAQAGGCTLLIPAFGAILYTMLPGVSESPWVWLSLCGLALVVAGVGGAWLLSMAEDARWAGLPKSARAWILASQCAGERFLALVRAGSPADLAWTKACELLSNEAPALGLVWGQSIWKAPPASGERVYSDPASRLFLDTGEALRRSVQLSLMEGRPCAERVEAALTSLSYEIKARIEAELTLLSARALKPLFVCVAPGVFLLLGSGIFLCFKHLAGDAL